MLVGIIWTKQNRRKSVHLWGESCVIELKIPTMAASNINWKVMKDAAVVAQLGKELRRMQLERNQSQAEVAEHAGLDRTTVVKLEAGRAATLQTVVQVLRAMDHLELLDAFHQEPQPTPYMLVETQEKYLKKKQRKRAGRRSRT